MTFADLPNDKRFHITMKTTVPGETIECTVLSRSRASAIRVVLRRAAFQDGRIEVTSVSVREVDIP